MMFIADWYRLMGLCKTSIICFKEISHIKKPGLPTSVSRTLTSISRYAKSGSYQHWFKEHVSENPLISWLKSVKNKKNTRFPVDFLWFSHQPIFWYQPAATGRPVGPWVLDILIDLCKVQRPLEGVAGYYALLMCINIYIHIQHIYIYTDVKAYMCTYISYNYINMHYI